jgi:hypothetical protein
MAALPRQFASAALSSLSRAIARAQQRGGARWLTAARRRIPWNVRWILVVLVVLSCAGTMSALDEVVLTNGRRYRGNIVSDTPESLVLSVDGGTVEFPRSSVVSPPYHGPAGSAKTEMDATQVPEKAHPLPSVANALRQLRDFSWAKNVRQVPALVTDRGRWQFLPCLSFWCGDFFQLSFYGDPARPAAIEVSLIQPPANAWEQKRDLLEYMLGLAPGLAVDSRFDKLDINGDSFAVGDLWFAVSNPASTTSPGRWAVLLMHEISLTPSRASAQELQAISEPIVMLDPNQPRSWQRGSWTQADLDWLQHTLSLTNPDKADNTGAATWTALGGERVFLRSFMRERGRYTRASNDWLREVAALTQP